MERNRKMHIDLTDLIANCVLNNEEEKKAMLSFSKNNKQEYETKNIFISLISRTRKYIEETPDFFKGIEDDLECKLSKVRRIVSNLQEKDRFELLINHKMEFLSKKMTVEERIENLINLTELDKYKLEQLEYSLSAKSSGKMDYDPEGYYDNDRKFLASFTDSEIEAFNDFLNVLPLVTENKMTR